MSDKVFPADEVRAAFDEYSRRGAYGRDWAAWAESFTDDAVYEEHHLGTMHGREAILEWIIPTMNQFPAMTFDFEWLLFDGNHITSYVWNNLPDPGTGKRYGFVNTSLMEYAGDGKFSWQADFYSSAESVRVISEWIGDGGRKSTPPVDGLGGVDGWTPALPTPTFDRDEVAAEFDRYRQRAVAAVATGDWRAWSEQFTENAVYREHHYGLFRGRTQISEWISSTMTAFPTMYFPVRKVMIDGNRVSSVIANVLPSPAGHEDTEFGFDVNTILHYAGNGMWSYEEDVYNPAEAQRVIDAWLAAGGTIPH